MVKFFFNFKRNFVIFLDEISRNKLCWDSLTDFATNKKINVFSIQNTSFCKEISQDGHSCKCGRFVDGKAKVFYLENNLSKNYYTNNN